MSAPGSLEWHVDGHEILFALQGPELTVLPLPCPNLDKPDPECQIFERCVFEYFVSIYGIDLNVGSVGLAPRIEFAWALQGDAWDLDGAQLWIIPVEDASFGPWLLSLEGEKPDSESYGNTE